MTIFMAGMHTHRAAGLHRPDHDGQSAEGYNKPAGLWWNLLLPSGRPRERLLK
jgi:hypothetical protein